MTKNKYWFDRAMKFFAALVASAMLFACGGGGSGPTGLKLSLTDAPACGYDSVWVTVEKIGVHTSASASNADAGWKETVLNPALKVDLLTLTNGVLQTLGQIPLAPGQYSQIRLVLASNDGADAYANSVLPTGANKTALVTTSAVQTGLKLNANITIKANEMADFVLDFDGCKSVVRAGQSGRYLLKPVVAVIPNYVSGVSGYLAEAAVSANTLVTLQQAGKVIKATTPDATTGAFLLQPVAPGSYDIVITSPGRATAVIAGVPVVDQQVTVLSGQTNKLALVEVGSGAVGGRVSIGSSSGSEAIDATVSVSQALALLGRNVEIASTTADADSGAYQVTLPADAPRVATYVTTQIYDFKTETVATAYTVSATANGVTKSSPVASLAGGQTIGNIDFVFP